MLHLAFGFVWAIMIGSKRRPWWQAALLLAILVPAHWLNFQAGRIKLGLDPTPPDMTGRLIVLIGMHLLVISAAWALGRWLRGRNRVRVLKNSES